MCLSVMNSPDTLKKHSKREVFYRVFKKIDGKYHSLFHGCGLGHKTNKWYTAINTQYPYHAFCTRDAARRYKICGSKGEVVCKVKFKKIQNYGEQGGDAAVTGMQMFIIGEVR
jgi:hypothetical protein